MKMHHTFINRDMPYAFARVRAMKGRLFSADDYHKLLKMDISSATKYLQDSKYRDSITSLTSEYEGLELIDQALKMNAIKVFNKLRRICTRDVTEVIDLYLGRSDFHNLKVVLRGIYSNAAKEEVIPLIEPFGRFGQEHFERLSELRSVDAALENSGFLRKREQAAARRIFESSKRLIELENYLDKLYYEHTLANAVLLPDHGLDFRKFLLMEIDIVNIINLLRLKSENIEPERIRDHLIFSGQCLRKRVLISLSKAESVEALCRHLARTYYGKHVDFSGRISSIEISIKRFHLIRARMASHQNLLSVSSILSYMLAKLAELRNLRSAVKAIYLGFDVGFVEKELLVV